MRLGRIDDIQLDKLDRAGGRGVSFTLRIFVHAVLTEAGGGIPPEGPEVVERLDFGPDFEPLDDFTRATVATLSGPLKGVGQLEGLIGRWAQFTLGTPNPHGGYQRITSWTPVSPPTAVIVASPVGPTFQKVKGGFSIHYPADGPYLIPFDDLECLRSYHQILAAAGRPVSPQELVLGPGGGDSSDAVRAAIDSGILAAGGQSIDRVLDDEAVDKHFRVILKRAAASAVVRKSGDTEEADEAKAAWERLAEDLGKQLCQPASGVFDAYYNAVLSDASDVADKAAKTFSRMRDRARIATQGDLARKCAQAVNKRLRHAQKVLREKELPHLVAHLKQSIRLRDGLFRYEPTQGATHRWVLS